MVTQNRTKSYDFCRTKTKELCLSNRPIFDPPVSRQGGHHKGRKMSVKTYYTTISYEGLQAMIRHAVKRHLELFEKPYRSPEERRECNRLVRDITDMRRALDAHPDKPRTMALPGFLD